jgi:MFS transporter, DHA2 family, multidrug resistance protein
VPRATAGAGASVSETGNELGVALGTAVLGSIMTAVYRQQLDDAPAEARDTLGAAHELAGDLGRSAGDALRSTADVAFVDGVRLASFVAAALLAGAGVASARISRREPSG